MIEEKIRQLYQIVDVLKAAYQRIWSDVRIYEMRKLSAEGGIKDV